MTNASVFDETPAEMDEATLKFLAEVLEQTGDHILRDLNGRILELLEEAPSDASVSLALRKEPTAIMGLLEVHSSQRKFSSARTDTEVAPVINAIFAGVGDQIDDWKRTRHASVPDPL